MGCSDGVYARHNHNVQEPVNAKKGIDGNLRFLVLQEYESICKRLATDATLMCLYQWVHIKWVSCI